jgi:hypothetical protein
MMGVPVLVPPVAQQSLAVAHAMEKRCPLVIPMPRGYASVVHVEPPFVVAKMTSLLPELPTE